MDFSFTELNYNFVETLPKMADTSTPDVPPTS